MQSLSEYPLAWEENYDVGRIFNPSLPGESGGSGAAGRRIENPSYIKGKTSAADQRRPATSNMDFSRANRKTRLMAKEARIPLKSTSNMSRKSSQNHRQGEGESLKGKRRRYR